MRPYKAESRRQKAESGIGLLLVVFALLAVAGCSVRVTPAASNSANISETDASVASNNEAQRQPEELAKTSNSAESSATTNSANSGRSIEQLVSAATAVEPATSPTSQDKTPISTERARDITFDTIKFDMDKEKPFLRSMITPSIEKIFGKRIRIRGYILPASAFEGARLSQFVLVRDNLECCFGPGAALYDCIVVEMSPGNTASFTNRPIAVEGVLSLSEVRDPDKEERHLAIYHMVADKAK